MRTIYQPGDSVLLYSENVLGRAWLWLRQFPKAVVCASFFALGVLFCFMVKRTPSTPPVGKPETALSILPNPFAKSGPYIFTDFVPSNAFDSAVVAYVKRFEDVAKDESDRYGIPASIKMAQAILETDAGRSLLARKNNNHFGIKCFSRTCKKGHCTNFGDDTHKDFFRKYGSAWLSWRAHSKMVVSGKYKALLKFGDDYEQWAKGLKRLGYATAKDYDKALIGLIEKFHLSDLD